MPEDITPQLGTIGTSVMDELIDRLDADLSEDMIAVATAITKAMMRAAKVMRVGAERRGTGPDPEEVDLWADTYGAGR